MNSTVRPYSHSQSYCRIIVNSKKTNGEILLNENVAYSTVYMAHSVICKSSKNIL